MSNSREKQHTKDQLHTCFKQVMAVYKINPKNISTWAILMKSQFLNLLSMPHAGHTLFEVL